MSKPIGNKTESDAKILCLCNHTQRIHSKKDGQCLGGTRESPMSCKCNNFDPQKQVK
jgi:hypothetical protein